MVEIVLLFIYKVKILKNIFTLLKSIFYDKLINF